MKEKIDIDPKEFAYAVIGNYQVDSEDDEMVSKKKLSRYLTAYYLADKFNQLEQDQFNLSKSNDLKKMLGMIGTNKY